MFSHGKVYKYGGARKLDALMTYAKVLSVHSDCRLAHDTKTRVVRCVHVLPGVFWFYAASWYGRGRGALRCSVLRSPRFFFAVFLFQALVWVELQSVLRSSLRTRMCACLCTFASLGVVAKDGFDHPIRSFLNAVFFC